ncbi:MAG: hypothetical protein KGK16_08960 [Bradyrhizobium sp.]|nr:hypothetical protein [Bradyrhizobium sp.]
MSSISIAEPEEAPEGIDGGYPVGMEVLTGANMAQWNREKSQLHRLRGRNREIQGEIGPGIGPISRAHFIRLCCRRRPAGILGEHSCFEALVAIAVALSIGASLVQQRTGIRAGESSAARTATSPVEPSSGASSFRFTILRQWAVT